MFDWMEFIRHLSCISCNFIHKFQSIYDYIDWSWYTFYHYKYILPFSMYNIVIFRMRTNENNFNRLPFFAFFMPLARLAVYRIATQNEKENKQKCTFFSSHKRWNKIKMKAKLKQNTERKELNGMSTIAGWIHLSVDTRWCKRSVISKCDFLLHKCVPKICCWTSECGKLYTMSDVQRSDMSFSDRWNVQVAKIGWSQ